MDAFRKEQRKLSNDSSPNKGGGAYGCACCRKVSHLGTHKRISRRLARTRLKRETFED
jgi:hypothetical protein